MYAQILEELKAIRAETKVGWQKMRRTICWGPKLLREGLQNMIGLVGDLVEGLDLGESISAQSHATFNFSLK